MNNVVKIGTAIKWRGVYDDKARYYCENMVTICGCIFRCKVLFTQGKAPVKTIDRAGHIQYDNPDIWEVVLDFLQYFNWSVDNESQLTDFEAQIRLNAKNIQKNKEEIDKIKGGMYYLVFDSSEGWQFFRGRVDTIITASILYVYNDVTKDILGIPGTEVVWIRDSGNQIADNSWIPQFINGQKNVLHLTNDDMPSNWGFQTRKVKFICKIYIPGSTIPIVDHDFGFQI